MKKRCAVCKKMFAIETMKKAICCLRYACQACAPTWTSCHQ